MVTLAIILGAFLVIYFFFYLLIGNGDVYSDLCDPNIKVKVIKKGFFKTTIAYLDKDPEKVLTLEFMLRYVPAIKPEL